MNMNNGYSKIKVLSNTALSGSLNSSSSDLLQPLPQSPKPMSDVTPKSSPAHTSQESNNQIIKNSNGSSRDSLSEQEDISDRALGQKLRRNGSVSSAHALQDAVMRAFSMRRSSSVSERYCRIHDQSATIAAPPFDDELEVDTIGTRRSAKKEKKQNRGKILKAWKKLFGL